MCARVGGGGGGVLAQQSPTLTAKKNNNAAARCTFFFFFYLDARGGPVQRARYPSVHAEDVPIYHAGEGHAVKHGVASFPHVLPERIPEPVLGETNEKKVVFCLSSIPWNNRLYYS